MIQRNRARTRPAASQPAQPARPRTLQESASPRLRRLKEWVSDNPAPCLLAAVVFGAILGWTLKRR